jgi:hypothetical protein
LEVINKLSIFAENKELMRKRLLIFSSFVLLMSTASMQAEPMVMAMEMGVAEQIEPERTININVEGKQVQVTGANGLVLEVISLTGRQVKTYRIENSAQQVELNIPKGCYILKIGKVVRKVTIP